MSTSGLTNGCVKHFLPSHVLPACLGPPSAKLFTFGLSITHSTIILSPCQMLAVREAPGFVPHLGGVNGLLTHPRHAEQSGIAQL